MTALARSGILVDHAKLFIRIVVRHSLWLHDIVRARGPALPKGRGSCYKTMRVEIVVAVENLRDPSDNSSNSVLGSNLLANIGRGLFHRMIHSVSGSKDDPKKWLGSAAPRL